MTIKYLPVVLVCAFLALWPKAEAVVPPPDGGYPNFTTAAGDHALQALTSGVGNTAVGTFSLFSVTTGNFNTALGAGALDLNTADSNTATGAAALLFNTTGTENTANGTAALEFNETGSDNTATGAFSLFSNTTGDDNTAGGSGALSDNTTGADNTAVGSQTLASNTTGNLNTAVGFHALMTNTTDGGNTALGSDALINYTSGGGGNTAIGDQALFALTAGGVNVALGFGAGASVTNASNTICIGTGGQNVSNSCYIGNIFGATSAGGITVLVNSDGKLGTVVSSRRFKEEIQLMERASETLFALKPVTFRYKEEIDPAGTSQFGLVAEDVEKVNPDLIVRDKEGKPYSVRYDQVNAMLLNEFLKEHKKVQDLESRLAQQEHQIECLSAGLQKVTGHLEMSRTAPQVAANGQ